MTLFFIIMAIIAIAALVYFRFLKNVENEKSGKELLKPTEDTLMKTEQPKTVEKPLEELEDLDEDNKPQTPLTPPITNFPEI